MVRHESAKLLYGGSIPPQALVPFNLIRVSGGTGIRATLKMSSAKAGVGSTPT